MTKNKKHNACKPEAWYGISRLTTRYGEQALYVTVARQGCRVNKGFTVSHYGTEEKALESAQAWRDAVLALLPPMTYTQLRSQPRKNSTSGITGVYREDRKYRGVEWVARIQTNGKAKTATFSVNIYGEEKAKELAIAAREQFLLDAEDRFFVVSEAADAITSRNFGSAQELSEEQRAIIVDASVKEEFMQRLRYAGLIGKPPTPAVQRRQFDSSNSAIWEARVSFPDGTRKTRRFAVSVYGEDEAKRLAEAAGKQFLAERNAMQQGKNPIICKTGFAEKLAAHPNEVLDIALEIFNLRFDAPLARILGLAPPVISKIRHNKLPLGSIVIVRLLEAADLHIRDLYKLVMKKQPPGIPYLWDVPNGNIQLY